MVQNRNNIDLEVILVLIKEKTHLRAIARLLNEPHVNVFRTVKYLRKEKVIDYKKEGKNNTYFIKDSLEARNYVFMAEQYKFIKVLKQYPELHIILSSVLKQTKDEMIILFGSYAKFIAKENSDIDIYIDTEDLEVRKKLLPLHSRLSIKLGAFDMSSLLIKEIVKNHVIVRGIEEFYEKSNFFETIET